ncbi:MAG: SDR family NAD(P)-dependent oxidoreductase, partial [Sphingobium sp.]
MSDRDLDGRVAVIFGAGRATAIGAHTGHMLARRGASVIISDIDGEAARSTAAAICDAGHRAIAVPADVSDEAQVRATIDAATSHFGKLDILFNNAAGLHLTAGDFFAGDIDVDNWRRTFEINTLGVMLACKHAIPVMLKGGGGSIINTSSGSSQGGELKLTAYSASKAAVNQFTRTVATQYGKRGIRCNAILPGMILTQAGRVTPEVQAQYLRHHLTPYVGEPDDIAHMVAFLASDAAKFVTGQLISVDGGIGAHIATFADDWERRV